MDEPLPNVDVAGSFVRVARPNVADQAGTITAPTFLDEALVHAHGARRWCWPDYQARSGVAATANAILDLCLGGSDGAEPGPRAGSAVGRHRRGQRHEPRSNPEYPTSFATAGPEHSASSEVAAAAGTRIGLDGYVGPEDLRNAIVRLCSQE